MMSGRVVLSVFVVLLILGGVVGLYFYIDKNTTKTPEKRQVRVLLQSVNNDGKEILSSICLYQNNTLIKCSDKSDRWEEFKLNENERYDILSNSEGYYTLKKEIYGVQHNELLTLNRIGNVSVSKEGDFHTGEGVFTLNINIEGLIQRPSVCIDESYGFYYARLRDTFKICPSWSNNTNTLKFCNSTNEYWRCSNIKNTTCTLEVFKPKRFEKEITECFQIGQDLQNINKSYLVDYRSWQILPSDYINIYIVDSDIMKVGEKIRYDYGDENDVGMKDLLFHLK